MVSTSKQGICNAWKIVGFLLLNQTCSQSVRSPKQSASGRIREGYHRNISNNVRDLSDYTAAAARAGMPSVAQTSAEILGQVLEAHYVIYVAE